MRDLSVYICVCGVDGYRGGCRQLEARWSGSSRSVLATPLPLPLLPLCQRSQALLLLLLLLLVVVLV